MNGKLLVGCSLPGAALFGGYVANAGHSSTAAPPGPAAAPPAAAAPTAPVVPAPAPAPAPAPIVSAPAPVEPNGPQTSFTDGQWVVGEEDVPGTYRSPGPADGPIKLCYVDTKVSDKIVGQEVSTDGPARIALADGQVIKMSGCQAFTKVG
jgi:hypothetical protein